MGLLKLLNVFKGYRTYLAAAGLFGLAAYQFSTGEVATGFQSLLAGLAAAGLRGAIPKAHA